MTSFKELKSPLWTQQMYVTKEKNVTLNVIKKFFMQAEIGPKHLDKLKPEPAPTRKARPDLQLWLKLIAQVAKPYGSILSRQAM